MTIEEFDCLLPKTFTIETVLACNLRCPECAIGSGIIQRRKDCLSYEQFKIVADKAKPFVRYFYLHLWGEPTLNKDIVQMVRYASEFCRTNISTHAVSLSHEMAEGLITAGLGDLIVSIDGFTQEVYEKYRVGGDVKKALANLALFQELNLKHGGKTKILPQFIVFRHNQHEVGLFTEHCKSLGLTPSFKAPYIRNIENQQFFNSDFPQYQRKEYDDMDSLRHAMSDCVNPKEVFTMQVDGSIIICCHDYDKQTCFGNIFEQDVLEIWDSPAFRKYRWDILSGNPPDFCLEKCMTFIPGKAVRKSTGRDSPVQISTPKQAPSLEKGTPR